MYRFLRGVIIANWPSFLLRISVWYTETAIIIIFLFPGISVYFISKIPLNSFIKKDWENDNNIIYINTRNP